MVAIMPVEALMRRMRVVVGVGEVKVVGGVKSEGGGGIDGGGCGGALVAGEPLGADACEGGDDAGGSVDAADAVVTGVGEVEIVCGVECYGGGKVELGRGCEGVVAGEAWDAGSRDGGDDAGDEIKFADAVIVGIGYVEIVGSVEGE